MRISDNITLEEICKSRTAKKHNILNIPTTSQIKNFQILSEAIFEPIRAYFNDNPIRISSAFRVAELCLKLGSTPLSQHCGNNGAAIDLDNDGYYPSNRQIFIAIYSMLEFDQLIWECGNDNSPGWVHVSFNEGKNRNEVLRYYPNTKEYKPFKLT